MKYIIYISLFFLSSCLEDPALRVPQVCKTKNVFIVVMDGARYSETWGSPFQSNVPNIKLLASQGVICSNFWNAGQTVTLPGHTAITTGNYQVINNGGLEIPSSPSIFQYYRSRYSVPAEDAWVISSKDKLEVLSDCMNATWSGTFRPRTDCGVNGNHTGYREDSVTYAHLIDTIQKHHPHMVLVNFKQPDVAGHANNWIEYNKQIKKVDQYIGDLWDHLQKDDNYKGTTTMIVTNDHGRHLNGVYDGFASHWCDCKGCRRIFMLGIGPDFKSNYIETSYYSLIDIPPTVARLLNFSLPNAQGKSMSTILK